MKQVTLRKTDLSVSILCLGAMQHSPFTLPLVSAGLIEQLKENLKSAELSLNSDQLRRLEETGV